MNNEVLNNEVATVEVVKPYTLRKLQASELFPILTILRKIGIKNFTNLLQEDAVKTLIKKLKNGEEIAESDYTEIGSIVFSAIDILIAGAEQCENELFKVLSNVSGKTLEEIGKLELDVLIAMIIEVIKTNMDFLKAVSKFLK